MINYSKYMEEAANASSGLPINLPSGKLRVGTFHCCKYRRQTPIHLHQNSVNGINEQVFFVTVRSFHRGSLANSRVASLRQQLVPYKHRCSRIGCENEYPAVNISQHNFGMAQDSLTKR